MAKHALITGVTGQTGSYLAELLLSKGYYVHGIARRTSTPNTSRLANVIEHPQFNLIRGDITDAHFVSSLLQKYYFHEVYNLAAQSFVGVSFDEPAHTMQVNFSGCLNLLEAIRNLPYSDKPRFYQASTSEMFGASYSMEQDYDQFTTVEHFDFKQISPEQVDAGCHNHPKEEWAELVTSHRERVAYWSATTRFPRPFWQDENTPFLPTSPYAIAKLAAHHLVKLYREAYGLFACSGILFNHESPRRGEEFVTRKVTRFVGKLSVEGSEKVGKLTLGNIKSSRDWGHAKDYVLGQFAMLQADDPDDYVLATGRTHTVEQLLCAAFGHVGLEWKDHVVISQCEHRPSEVPCLLGKASKAAEKLEWEPRHSFEELIREMVDADIKLAKREAAANSVECEDGGWGEG